MYQLLILLLVSFALAQDDDKVCFYINENYGGAKLCGSEGQWIDVIRSNNLMHDAFRSAKVPFGLQVLAFFDADFKGKNKIFQENTPDLGSFNDQISAFVVQPARPCIYNGTRYAEGGDCDKVCFYADGNFTGTKLCGVAGQRIDVLASHQSMQNTFSSVQVPVGLQVLAFINGNFTGGSKLFRDDAHDLGSFNDEISSFIVQPARPCFYTGTVYTESEDCDKVCFYVDKRYTGAKLCGIEGERIDVYATHRNIQDAFSSVKVPVGLQVTAYFDGGFTGRKTTFRGNTPSIGLFNDQISSFIVEAAEACFYSGAQYTGTELCVPVGDAVDLSMMPTMNDTIESVKVPRGLLVKLFTGEGFQGRFTWISTDTADLSEFNNVVSSLIVQYENEVCFYTDIDYRGLSLCSKPGETYTIVATFETTNDVFSSVRVPHDIFVEAYLDSFHRGMSRVFVSDVSNLTDFSNDISSFFVSFSGTACFYTEQNWNGARVCAPFGNKIDVATNFTAYNDSFQSVIVPNELLVKAYQQAHFEGEMVPYDGANKSLGAFSNVISSFEVTSAISTPYQNLAKSDIMALQSANPHNLTVCMYINDQGAWKVLYNDSCRSSTKRYACNNVYSSNLWRISSQSGIVYNGTSVCRSEFGDDFTFSTPMNAHSNTILSGLSIPSDGVWINLYHDAFSDEYSHRERRSTDHCGGIEQRACTYDDSLRDSFICFISLTFACREPYCDEGLTRLRVFDDKYVCKCPTNRRPRRGLGDFATSAGACGDGACGAAGGIRKPLTGEEIVKRLLIKGSTTKQMLATAWSNSCIGGNLFQERGGWVFANPDDPTKLQVVRAPESASSTFRATGRENPAINLEGSTAANANRGWVIVANFHTHPLSTNQEPSTADLRNAFERNVPGIVISRDGIYVYGPECRTTFRTLRSLDPRAYPNNGDISNFNPNARQSVKRLRENPFPRKHDEL